MPKVQRIRISAAARIKAKAIAASEDHGLPDSQQSQPQQQQPPSAQSLKSKRDARREQWLQKISIRGAAMYKADQVQKKIMKGGVAADLDSLKFALAETELAEDGDEASDPKKKSHKAVSQSARLKKNLSEIVRLQKVINHSSFRANPLATIRTHLQNTLPSQTHDS